jgi:hypothetical protein
MPILFSGSEIPSNRTLLERAGVTNTMLSYWGLKKRGLPKTKAYLIGEHFDPNMKVYVDSGATQADKSEMTMRELEEYAADYEEFVAENWDRIEGWVEFDSERLGLNRVQQARAAAGNDQKMWVVWHEAHGTMVLQRWASEFKNIAINGDTIESMSSLAGVTRSLQQRYGTKFHALATAKPDNLRSIPFSTASTLSWLSPMRRGETIVWDGTRLARYPKTMKAQARSRYKAVVERAGLDFSKFISDDTLEATKVAVWSFLQVEATMDKDRPKLTSIPGGKSSGVTNGGQPRPPKDKVADNSDDTLYTGLMDFMGGGSTNSDVEVRNTTPVQITKRDPDKVQNLPVFGFTSKDVVGKDADGNDELQQEHIVASTGSSLRQCNTCFVASNCPAFQPDSECGFNFPVEVKSPDQLKGLLTSVIEMQANRVAFMRFSEELNGGYADPNLSSEMDRLMKLVERVKDMDSDKEFIQITASRQAGAGVLSSIFGDKAAALKDIQAAQQPPQRSISAEQTTLIIHESLEGK